LSAADKGADLLFTELVDAVRYSRNWQRSIAEQAEANAAADRQMEALAQLSSRISDALGDLDLGPEDSKSLSRKINEFSNLAIEQAKDKVKARLRANLDAATAEAKSAELKAKKSLESYLAATPLPVIDQDVSLDLADGSYSAKAEYKCAGEIEYEFLLNTAASPHFREELAFSRVRKGVKLPVRLGKTWLRKELVPDYEKLDDYALSRARASKGHLEATLVHPETGSKVELVFSKSGSDSFVTISYADEKGEVDVTGEAGLSRHVDLPTMKGVGARILDAILDLSMEKLQLSRVECAGVDVLATLDCSGFMQQAVRVLVRSKTSVAAMSKVNPKLAIERLNLLGPEGAKIKETLGLTARG